ncbi:hypothetical protein FRB98_009216, partial [Tulasnella sp. 332]
PPESQTTATVPQFLTSVTTATALQSLTPIATTIVPQSLIPEITATAPQRLTPDTTTESTISLSAIAYDDLFSRSDNMLNDNFNNIRVIFVQFKTETSVIAGASKLTNTEQDELKKKVLSKYHDLLEVFLQRSATKLALHCPGINLEINLEPGKELPFKPIITLTLSECQALKDWVKKGACQR